MTQNDLKRAYDLIRANRLDEARQILIPLVKAQPDSIDGWWLLSWTVTEPDQIRAALNQVLMIDPFHEQAAERLEKLGPSPKRQTTSNIRSIPNTADLKPVNKKKKNNAAPILGVMLLLVMVIVAAGALFLVLGQSPQSSSEGFGHSELPTLNPVVEARAALTQVAEARAQQTQPTQTPQPPTATPILKNTLPPTWTPSATWTLLPLPTITFPASPRPTRSPTATFAFPTAGGPTQEPVHPASTEVALVPQDSSTGPGLDTALLARTYWYGDGDGSMEDRQVDGEYLRQFDVPVTVWIDAKADITWRHKTEEAVAVLNAVVPIRTVSSQDDADIPIYVMSVEGYLQWCPIQTAGCAEIGIQPDASGQYLEVTSWVRVRADSAPNANLIAHELIHALGVGVHSPDPRDVMYFQYNKQDQDLVLTNADSLILEILYDQPALGAEFARPD